MPERIGRPQLVSALIGTIGGTIDDWRTITRDMVLADPDKWRHRGTPAMPPEVTCGEAPAENDVLGRQRLGKYRALVTDQESANAGRLQTLLACHRALRDSEKAVDMDLCQGLARFVADEYGVELTDRVRVDRDGHTRPASAPQLLDPVSKEPMTPRVEKTVAELDAYEARSFAIEMTLMDRALPPMFRCMDLSIPKVAKSKRRRREGDDQ